MSTGSDSPADSVTSVRRYHEALRTPWWWYVVAVIIAGILAAEFRVAGLHATVWIPFGILIPLAAAIVWWLGRSRVEIRDGELHVRGAHVDLRYVSGAVALDQRTLRLVVGREGDPLAFVSIRPWIKGGVQVWLDDEDDPTPYWVISTRRPAELVTLLRAAG